MAKCFDIPDIARRFQVAGKFVSGAPYGTGHINDTYRTVYDSDGKTVPYILQRINHNVFRQPVPLMDNVLRVTEHQRRKLEQVGEPDLDRRALRLVPAEDGRSYYQDGDGNVWRTFLFIHNACTYDFIEDPNLAFQAARAFGEFQRQLVDLPGGRLFETIPDFHTTPIRFRTFVKAVEVDAFNRAAQARAEIDFVLSHEDITGTLLDKHGEGLIPERIAHNDTKVSNVMLDDRTQEGLCVIDLDTVMPGMSAYDFGEMIRTYTSPTEEDERDLSKVHVEMPMFEALARGYLACTHTFLTPTEKEYLVFGGKLMTFENGMRFLTDFLSGDVYYKIHREGQNLDRCRTQFRLVELLIEREPDMNAFVIAWQPDS